MKASDPMCIQVKKLTSMHSARKYEKWQTLVRVHNAQNYHSNLFLVFIKLGSLDIEEAESIITLIHFLVGSARDRITFGFLYHFKRAAHQLPS